MGVDENLFDLKSAVTVTNMSELWWDFFEKPGECFPQKADNCLPLLTLIKKPHVPDHHPQSREVNPLWLQLLAAITQCLLDVTPSLQTASAAMLTLTLFYQSHFKPALDI